MPFGYAKVENSDDSLGGQSSHAERGRRTWWTTTLDRFAVLRWPVTLFLLLAVLVCEISILRKQPPSLPIGGEVNGIVPHFSLEKKIFRSDERYASDHKTPDSINMTKAAWIELMPRMLLSSTPSREANVTVGDGGFMQIPDYTKYSLPPPMHFESSPGKEVFTIAVFHEMHCLMHMAAYMDKLVMQIRNKEWMIDEGRLAHNDHCFNYLHNALMCAADTTLEGQSQAEMFRNVPGTDGTGAVHNCRNYDEVYKWAEEHRLTEGREHL